MDCTTESSTCSKFGVSGYPTLKIFKDGELSKAYDGPREKGMQFCWQITKKYMHTHTHAPEVLKRQPTNTSSNKPQAQLLTLLSYTTDHYMVIDAYCTIRQHFCLKCQAQVL